MVLSTILLAVAVGSQARVGSPVGALDVLRLFATEALGGGVLGLATGLLAYGLMKRLDEHNIEVMITLALGAGAYALGLRLHVSGPIAVVIAGVLIGNHGAAFAMSENTRRHVFQFWDLVDELLNSVLFLLIGLEVLLLRWSHESAWLALAAIPIALLARLADAQIAAWAAADPDMAAGLKITGKAMAPALVQTLRRQLNFSQAQFAERYGIPVHCIRA